MRKSDLQKTTMLVGGIILFLVFFNYLGGLNFGKKTLRQIFVPFIRQSGEFSIKIKDDYEFFQNKEQKVYCLTTLQVYSPLFSLSYSLSK